MCINIAYVLRGEKACVYGWTTLLVVSRLVATH